MFLVPSPLQKIETSWSRESQINLYVKREDLIHPLLSGNKYRKLKYNLEEAKKQGKKTIVTFGGAFSNHIHALAATCHFYGFDSIGIIRGEESSISNPTLTDAKNWGMQLKFIDRSSYRNKNNEEFISILRKEFGDFYLIPEGGTNQLAIKGSKEILAEVAIPFSYVCVAVGTGGTIAGLIQSCPKESKVLGFSALKGDFIHSEVENLLETKYENWFINTSFHFGGYAKTKPTLWDFIHEFKEETGIQLDAIYTGKMMFGIRELVQNNFFPIGENVVVIHTGGLQGLRGFTNEK